MRLTKAEKRLRLKRAWFEAGTAAFERVCPGARSRKFPELDNPYICPICTRPFTSEALIDNTLTLEDAPPKSYGGKPIALTCKGCNNQLGSALDGPLSTLDSAAMSPCRLGMGGVEVQAYQEIRDGGRSFAIPQNQNDPKKVARFFEGLDAKPGPSGSLQMTYKHDVEERRRADLAWLKTAYIVTFAAWGYFYALSPVMKIVRAQILNPDQTLIPKFKIEKRSSPRDMRFLMLVRTPAEIGGIAVGMGQYIVFLPVMTGDMTYYERLEPILSRNEKTREKIKLFGDITYPWPTAPRHELDIRPLDSRLVLPSSGEIRALT